MSRIDPSGEPARQPDYRRSYAKMHAQIVTQTSCITFLLAELRALQKRVNQLEEWRANPYTQMVGKTLAPARQLAERDCDPPPPL